MQNAILFDFDGTLANTSNDNFKAWQHVFSKYVELKPEDYFLLEGSSVGDVVKQICEKYKITEINIEETVKNKDDYYLNNNTFSLYPGVYEVISLLNHRKVPTAIVTAARMYRVKRCLSEEILKKFTVIISGDRIKCKPDPEIYLTASQALNISPDNCVVIENAPLGIQSAKSAGMYCIALATTLDKKYLRNAHEIFNTFLDASLRILELAC